MSRRSTHNIDFDYDCHHKLVPHDLSIVVDWHREHIAAPHHRRRHGERQEVAHRLTVSAPKELKIRKVISIFLWNSCNEYQSLQRVPGLRDEVRVRRVTRRRTRCAREVFSSFPLRRRLYYAHQKWRKKSSTFHDRGELVIWQGGRQTLRCCTTAAGGRQ